MDSLTLRQIDSNNSLFEQYLKRALYWDESKQFTNGLSRSDFNDSTKAYGLYGDDHYVGFSLVKFDENGNVVSFKSVVDSLKNNNSQLSEFLDQYISSIDGETTTISKTFVKKIGRI